MGTTLINTKIGNASKPLTADKLAPFAYSLQNGLVSRLSPLELANIRYPILTKHYLTTAQILEMGV